MSAARYADGRTAVTQDVDCEFGAGTLIFRGDFEPKTWNYLDLRRGDDNNGLVTLRRKRDTGERLYLSPEAAHELRACAPFLFTSRAHGVERPAIVWSLTGAAASLAAIFLVGVPLFAGPIADRLPQGFRDQISEIAWAQVYSLGAVCENSFDAQNVLGGLAFNIAESSGVPQREAMFVTILDTPLPNALAMPDHSIIITTGLLQLAEHPDEIAGVIAHEIAHIEHNHVLKNIIGNVGAGIFFDVIFGGAGVGQMIAIGSSNLAGLRYSRGFEEEADASALDYLDAAGVDPAALARLFDRLREYEVGAELPAFLSTHPNTAERSARARARARAGQRPSMNAEEWALVRSACSAPLYQDQPQGIF